jgi:23S rRNA (guanosine2251-2'-O)-methyltransferase
MAYDKQSMVFGVHSVLETLRSGKEVEKIFLQKGMRNEHSQEISQLARSRNIPMSIVPQEKLHRVTRKNHQGVICFVSPINYAPLENVVAGIFESGEDPFILVLDGITDVRNFGAIARSAECAGVHAIIIPAKNSAQVNEDAMKTSVGAFNFIPVCRVAYLDRAVDYLKQSGISVVTCTEKATKSVYHFNYKSPIAIVMGSEETGVSDEIRKMSDQEVKIPMQGQIGSLNVSVATSIIAFEAVRQRGLNG